MGNRKYMPYLYKVFTDAYPFAKKGWLFAF
jgi:hypothetical protein